MKPYKIVNYKFGIISNLDLEQFIELLLVEEPDYDLFQVIEYYVFQLGGGYTVTRVILKLK